MWKYVELRGTREVQEDEEEHICLDPRLQGLQCLQGLILQGILEVEVFTGGFTGVYISKLQVPNSKFQ